MDNDKILEEIHSINVELKNIYMKQKELHERLAVLAFNIKEEKTWARKVQEKWKSIF